MKVQYFLWLKVQYKGIVIEDNKLQTIKQAIIKYYGHKTYVRIVSVIGNTIIIEKYNGYKAKKEAEKESKVLQGKIIYLV